MTTTAHGVSAASPPPRVHIPGYRIRRRLAASHRASVYLAQHVAHGVCAVKVVSPRLASQARFRERFFAAIERARLLDHPNIVRVFAAGGEDETLYMVMEYLRGGDLDSNLAAGLHTQHLLKAVTQLAAALDYASARGVMHLGIKPGNILFKAQGAALLTDFGLSPLLAELDDRPVENAQDGEAGGWAAYASPEQVSGEPLDVRADLYGLGVVFHRALTGRLPFVEPTAVGGSPAAAPVLPLQWAPFTDVFRSLLARAPADRFQSGAQVAKALGSLRTAGLVPDVTIRTNPVTAREIDVVAGAEEDERVGLTARRARRRLTAWAVPLALLVIVVAGGVWYAERQPAVWERALASVGLVEHPDVVLAWQEADALGKEASSGLAAVVDASRRVLTLAPGHQGAARLIAEVTEKWRAEVRAALAAGDADAAAAKLNELGAVFPEDAELPTLFDLLNDHRQAKRLLADTASLLAGDGLSHPPSADRAIATYREVLRLAPENAEALAALNDIATFYGALAARAARDGELSVAMENMERASAANENFEGAEAVRTTLSEAEALREQIAALLREAAALRERGALIEPPGDNAAERYRRVLATKPDNEIAVQGLAEVASQVQADFANLLEGGELDAARDLLERAAASGIGDDRTTEMNARYDSELARIEAVARLVSAAEALCADGYITGPSLDDNCVARLREVQRLDSANADAIRLLSVAATRLHTVAREAYDVGMKEDGLRYLDLALTVTPGISRWRQQRQRWQRELDGETRAGR